MDGLGGRITLRPVGTIVEFEFPPDPFTTDDHSGHGHTWRYRVEKHVEVAPMYSSVDGWAEALKPVERICKEG